MKSSTLFQQCIAAYLITWAIALGGYAVLTIFTPCLFLLLRMAAKNMYVWRLSVYAILDFGIGPAWIIYDLSRGRTDEAFLMAAMLACLGVSVILAMWGRHVQYAECQKHADRILRDLNIK